jgi:hypothetical protein
MITDKEREFLELNVRTSFYNEETEVIEEVLRHTEYTVEIMKKYIEERKSKLTNAESEK